MHLTSADNPLVKRLVRLRSEAKERQQSQQILLIGRKIIEEVAQKLPILELWHCDEYPIPAGVGAKNYYSVSMTLMRKISALESPDGYAAVINMPPLKQLSRHHRLLALDRVSDPANVGALMRSAWALGWDGMLLLPGCCDPYNDKALRTSRGAPLFFPWQRLSENDMWQLCEKHKILPMAAMLEGTPLNSIGPLKDNIVLILGSEGQGIDPALAAKCSGLTIPIDPAVESLNVGAAAAILLWHLNL